jgi:hypothetical protein
MYVPDTMTIIRTEADDIPASGSPARIAASGVLGAWQSENEALALPTQIYDWNVSPLPAASAIPAKFYSYPTPDVNATPTPYSFADYWRRIIYGK